MGADRCSFLWVLQNQVYLNPKDGVFFLLTFSFAKEKVSYFLVAISSMYSALQCSS